MEQGRARVVDQCSYLSSAFHPSSCCTALILLVLHQPPELPYPAIESLVSLAVASTSTSPPPS
eukprot:5599774-Pyramimonas_sp.AAC.1